MMYRVPKTLNETTLKGTDLLLVCDIGAIEQSYDEGARDDIYGSEAII